MKGILWGLLFLCPWVSEAQKPTGLKVGDKVPDVELTNISNFQATTGRLYAFKNKLVLLDLWATTCSACIGELKLLDSLQRCYPEYMSVLAINSLNDTRDRLDKLTLRLKLKVNVPMVLGNTELQALFPHYAVPHFAWLDSNFRVMAITGAEPVTVKRIMDYIHTGIISFSEEDKVQSFNFNQRLFAEGNGGDGRELFARSSISTRIPGIPSGNYPVTDSSGRITRLLLTNQSVEDLLCRAYQYQPDIPRLKWEGIPLTGEFCYELITPPVSELEAYRLLREDLARYLHIEAETGNNPLPTLFIHHLPN